MQQAKGNPPLLDAAFRAIDESAFYRMLTGDAGERVCSVCRLAKARLMYLRFSLLFYSGVLPILYHTHKGYLCPGPPPSPLLHHPFSPYVLVPEE